ncbi:MAG: hypothetical protein IPK04_15360 [Bdellovibrionales bacterium]|nr:hypothetical protein [Bdellovibrionales bacterium]
MEQNFGSPDLMICDDMNTESADFFFADRNKKKVVFIHAKALPEGKGGKISAKKMQEVISQAGKNLRYLSKFGNEAPKHINRWGVEAWSAKDVTGTVKNRIRIPSNKNDQPTAQVAWQQVRTILKHPESSPEVWLVVGNTLCKQAFLDDLKNNSPKLKPFS